MDKKEQAKLYANILVEVINDNRTELRSPNKNFKIYELRDSEALKKYWAKIQFLGFMDYRYKEKIIKKIIGDTIGIDLTYSSFTDIREDDHLIISFEYEYDKDYTPIAYTLIRIEASAMQWARYPNID
jgi:hypothetical protein